MFVTVLVAFALDAASASPSPSAPAAATASTRPLREVVYSVDADVRLDQIAESYGGGADATDPGSTGYLNAQGTVTVDVTGRQQDGELQLTVTENWKEQAKPVSFGAFVRPDGYIGIESLTPSAIDDAPDELLPFFGTAFAPLGTLSTTTRWTQNANENQLTISTEYDITSVSGDTVTVHKIQTIKGGDSASVDGSVVYQPSMLMPISGDITKKTTHMFADGSQSATLTIHFSLVSDSFHHPSQ